MVQASLIRSDPFVPGVNASGRENGNFEMHHRLHAVVAALPDHDLRRRLQLVIGASFAGSCEDGAGLEMAHAMESHAAYVRDCTFMFGPFRLFPPQRLLLEDDRCVRIGSRAFDILTVLVHRAGEVVGTDELIKRVWPNVFVGNCNLKTQVSALRRILGAGRRFIVAIPGRGYSFVAPVSSEPSRIVAVPVTAPIEYDTSHD